MDCIGLQRIGNCWWCLILIDRSKRYAGYYGGDEKREDLIIYRKHRAEYMQYNSFF
jgi:hypothetical protein